MASHLQQFAHHLIARHGQRTAGMVWAAYVNQLGNVVKGETAEEQIAAIEAELRADDRLTCSDAPEGYHGGATFAHARNHQD